MGCINHVAMFIPLYVTIDIVIRSILSTITLVSQYGWYGGYTWSPVEKTCGSHGEYNVTTTVFLRVE